MHCVGQNGFSNLLQASYTLRGRQNGLSKVIQPPIRFAELNTDSPKLYKLPRDLR